MNSGHGADMFQSRAYTSGVSRPQRDSVERLLLGAVCYAGIPGLQRRDEA